MDLGKNIKIFRKKSNLTQKQLATNLNVSVRTIQNYEGNQREPNIETLNKIATALDIPLSTLMNNDLNSYFSLSDSKRMKDHFNNIESYDLNIDSIKNELMNIANKEYTESIAYIENLTDFYTHIEALKHNGAFTDIDDIETKINETNIDNFKKFLNPSDLKISLKSLELTVLINDFLEDPKDTEIQNQLQIVLDSFDVPKGKKLKLTLVDSE